MTENPNPLMSSGEPDCESLQALLPAYSIGATTENETRLVKTLLPLCPDVAAELPEYVALSEAILQTVPPAIPPATLHDKLMTLTANTAAPGTLVSQTAQPKPRAVPLNRFWMSAAAALLVLLFLSNTYWASVTSQIRQTQDEVMAQLQQQDTLIAALAAGNVEQVSLNASEGNARVFWNTEERVAILSTAGLPILSPDQTYQLWLIDGNTPISAGIFTVDDEGRSILIFNPPQGLDSYDGIGISTEPAGGSLAPTTDPIAVGEM